MQNSISEKGGDDVGTHVGSPKPGESRRKLFVFVEIAEVEDNLLMRVNK
jgi:hypothetical protein